jgi:flagellin-specific chaperone FliS
LWTLIQQNAEVNDALEIKRVTEKISVLVNKLEVKTLIENFESLYNHISESLMKEKILLAVCKAVK